MIYWTNSFRQDLSNEHLTQENYNESDNRSHTPSPSFLRVARSLNLDGPSDWSGNLENYLYGDTINNEA